MSLEVLISKLEKVKPRGAGRWQACCPAHADKGPSLSIKETEDGRVLVHCFAGCSVHEVVNAIGLELTDLFPATAVSSARRERRPFPAADALRAVGFEALVVCAAAAAIAAGQPLTSDMTASWMADEASSLVPSDPVLGKLTLSPKSGGVFTKFSRLLARQGKVADGLLQLQMLKAVGSLVDQAIVSGTGENGQPLGIVSTPGISHCHGISYNNFLVAEYNSEVEGSVNAFSMVTHPLVRFHIKNKDFNHRWEHETSGQRFGGWPAYVSKDVPIDTAIVGPWEDCIFALWGTPVLEINPNDPVGFKTNVIQARIVIDCDVGVLNPTLWMKYTEITDIPEIEVI